MMRTIYLLFVTILPLAGCGDARMELAAADAMPQIAEQIDLAIHEYHALIEARYADREAAVFQAFTARVARDREAGPAVLDQHAVELGKALARIRADRETELARLAASRDNVETLRQMATAMRGVALESISLRDEVRRYLTGWIDVLERERAEHKKAQAAAASQPGRIDWAAAARAGIAQGLRTPGPR